MSDVERGGSDEQSSGEQSSGEQSKNAPGDQGLSGWRSLIKSSAGLASAGLAGSAGLTKMQITDIDDRGVDVSTGAANTDNSVLSFLDRGGIVAARGTKDGLVIRLDARVPQDTLEEALREFIEGRRSFLAGQEVFLEWFGAVPEDSFVCSISELLAQNFDIKVAESRLGVSRTARGRGDDAPAKARGTPAPKGAKERSDLTGMLSTEPSGGLFAGMRSFSETGVSGSGVISGLGAAVEKVGAEVGSVDSLLWDDADARMIFATLRSGQRVESEHTIVVIGDVNSGAEIVAGGDILVIGTLRGVAHAGAYDETGGGRFIFALNLQPTQLRIGAVISRGAGDASRAVSDAARGAEIARVDGTLIVVEQYHPKSTTVTRRYFKRAV